MTLSRRALLALPLPLVLLVACGDDTVTARPAADGDDPGGPVPDADTPVFQVVRAGGFVPPLTDVRTLPVLVLYADGRVVTQAAQIEIFPPPALTRAQVGRAAEGAVAELRRRAGDAGMAAAQPGDQDSPDGMTVADAPSTFVTYWAEDGTRQDHRFSQLGFAGRLSPRQEKVQALIEYAQALATGDALLEVDRLGVWARDVTAEAPDPEMPPGTAVWPVAGKAPSADACLTLTGDDAAAVMKAAEGTSTVTRWTVGRTQYELGLRPLLPHEADCAATQPVP